MSPAKASVTQLDPKGGAHPIEPDFPSFARRYDEGAAQVAWTRLVADLETPVSVTLKLAHERPNSFLLESVEGGSTRGRYSIIGCEPDLVFRANGAIGPRSFCALAVAHARIAPRPPRRVRARAAARASAHGGRHFRLHGLRHGPADRAARHRTPTETREHLLRDGVDRKRRHEPEPTSASGL